MISVISFSIVVVSIMLFTIFKLHYSEIINDTHVSAKYVYVIKALVTAYLYIAVISLLCFIVSFVTTYLESP